MNGQEYLIFGEGDEFEAELSAELELAILGDLHVGPGLPEYLQVTATTRLPKQA